MDVLTKVLAFDLFAIHRRFLMNLSDQWKCDLVDQQVNVCLSVCTNFQVLTQLESAERKEKDQGAVAKHLSDLLVLGG